MTPVCIRPIDTYSGLYSALVQTHERHNPFRWSRGVCPKFDAPIGERHTIAIRRSSRRPLRLTRGGWTREETAMRKILLSMLVMAGLALASAVPASANAAGAISHRPAAGNESGVIQIGRWGHRHHHGLSIGFGWGYPRHRYWGYPRYSHYDDYSYYRPRYHYRPSDTYYYYAPVRRHRHRHWRDRHHGYEW
jgi:hypothetical protein